MSVRLDIELADRKTERYLYALLDGLAETGRAELIRDERKTVKAVVDSFDRARRERGNESARAKGRRLLAEGRLTVLRAGGDVIVAQCRGDSGEIYNLGYDPNAAEWRCTCPEPRGLCSHLVALKLVTIRPPKEGHDG